jgi:hypothetical protein
MSVGTRDRGRPARARRLFIRWAGLGARENPPMKRHRGTHFCCDATHSLHCRMRLPNFLTPHRRHGMMR